MKQLDPNGYRTKYRMVRSPMDYNERPGWLGRRFDRACSRQRGRWDEHNAGTGLRLVICSRRSC